MWRLARAGGRQRCDGRGAANAQTKYDAGAGDTEIKIGTIMPFTRPAAAYPTLGHTIAAYFKKVNAQGGIKGRKLALIAYDAAYNPARTLQQARRLVEDDQVLMLFASL